MKFSFPRYTDYKKLLKELENGLRKLDFRHNFNSYVSEVILAPNEEKRVYHSLKKVPNYYIIGSQSSQGQVIDGSEEWTDKYISLKNTSNNEIKLKLIIME